MQIKNKKNIFYLLALFVLLLSSTIPVHADFNWPSPSASAIQGMNGIMGNLGINRSALQYGIATMNASPQKQTAPQVSLTFSPSDPQLGDKLTATATPLYFINDTSKMYFTWFLKLKDCDKTDSPSSTERSKCDLNGDGRVDIEDYKIEAMRIIANADFDWEKADYSHSDGQSSYKAVFGGDDQRGKNPTCYIQDISSGNAYPINCNSHLFPDAPHENTGDGSYGRDEEQFWHTDPTSADTAQTGNTDEANVTGLGINAFTWNYTPGDEVGVVVEGSSIEPSTTMDGSYRTMWAAPNGLCYKNTATTNTNYPKTSTVTLSTTTDTPSFGETTTVTEKTTQAIQDQEGTIATINTTVVDTTTVTDSSSGAVLSQNSSTISSDSSTVDISGDINNIALQNNGRTVQNVKNVSDLNDCLYDNLVTPSENGPSSNKLDVSLSYAPNSPINDPASYSDPGLSNGDELIVQSSVPNANDANYLQYSWEVFAGDDPNPDSWGSPIAKSDLPNATQMDGLGISSFKFKLNLPHPKKYLNVKLTVQESVGGGLFREGRSSILIPLTSNNDSLAVYSTSASNSTTPHVSMVSKICTAGVESAVCPVAKDSIIGVKIDDSSLTDFLWTIDGTPFTYQSCFFDNCDPDQQTNVAYFPALKEVGDQYTVNLTATNQATGDKVNISRVFQVVAPSLGISSADENVCKPIQLGNYIDTNGKKWPDYSTLNFVGLSNSPLKFQVVSNGFSADPANYTWLLDGNVVTSTSISGASVDSNGILTIPASLAGANHNISVQIVYAPDDATKNALSQYWNAPFDQFYEQDLSAAINVTVQDGSLATASNQPGKIMATIYAGTPTYLAFLLRMALTLFLILFTSQLMLLFFPGISTKD